MDSHYILQRVLLGSPRSNLVFLSTPCKSCRKCCQIQQVVCENNTRVCYYLYTYILSELALMRGQMLSNLMRKGASCAAFYVLILVLAVTIPTQILDIKIHSLMFILIIVYYFLGLNFVLPVQAHNYKLTFVFVFALASRAGTRTT